MIILISTTITFYIIVNVYVAGRINRSYYTNLERRALHKKLIWFLPFIGPLMLREFWRKGKAITNETITKDQREKSKGDFYESGIGLDS
jgi:hypothetical protein